MRALVLAAAALISSAAAVADEGELFASGSVGVDATWLRHPIAPMSPLPDAHTTLAAVPRFSLDIAYGLTNELTASVGVGAAGAANFATRGVIVDDQPADLVTGTYAAFELPLSLQWRFDSGLPITVSTALEVGPTIAAFVHTVAVDPTQKDETGRPLQLPIVVGDAYVPGVEVRVAAGVDFRLAPFVFALRPAIGFAWVHAPTWSLGGVLAVEVATDVGPR